jgi:hypothetical protein
MAGLFDEWNPSSRIPTNQYDISVKKITRGSLIAFYYPHSWAVIPNIIHDPFPMVIITDIWPRYIRGLNLHYFTFPYIKHVLGTHGGKTGFSYFHIRSDKYMANAFRMYVRQGIRQPKLLDVDFLNTVLKSAKSFSPGELEQIRAEIQRQIQQRLQVKAEDLTSYEEWKAKMTESQKRQLRSKGFQMQKALTGGLERNLVYPNKEEIITPTIVKQE